MRSTLIGCTGLAGKVSSGTGGEPSLLGCSIDDTMYRGWHEVAAVGERRVEARHLQRRDGDVLLPDRHLDQVTRVPGAVDALVGRLAPGGRRQESCRPRRRCRARGASADPNSSSPRPAWQSSTSARARRACNSGCRRRRSTCRRTARATVVSDIGAFMNGFQLVEAMLVEAVPRRDGVHWMYSYGESSSIRDRRERRQRLETSSRAGRRPAIARLIPG